MFGNQNIHFWEGLFSKCFFKPLVAVLDFWIFFFFFAAILDFTECSGNLEVNSYTLSSIFRFNKWLETGDWIYMDTSPHKPFFWNNWNLNRKSRSNIFSTRAAMWRRPCVKMTFDVSSGAVIGWRRCLLAASGTSDQWRTSGKFWQSSSRSRSMKTISYCLNYKLVKESLALIYFC